MYRPVLSEIFLVEMFFVSGFVNTVSLECAQERSGNGRQIIICFPIGLTKAIKKLTYHLRDGFTTMARLDFGLFYECLIHS